jgi:hypothetical protein
MSMYSWAEVLATAQAAGPTVVNTTTVGSIIPTGSIVTLPNNFFNAPGKALQIKATGQLSNIVTTPGTILFDVFLGGSVVAFSSGALQMSSTAHTSVPFDLDLLLTCRSIGSGTSATLWGQGKITCQALSLTAVADSTTTPATLLLPSTTPTIGTGFDSTAVQSVNLRATFSIANAGNGITLQQYVLIALN